MRGVTGAGLGLLAILSGCSLPAAPEGPRPLPTQYIDLTDDFARAYDASAGQPVEARAVAIRSAMNSLLPEFYSAEYRGAEQARIDRFVADYIAGQYPAERPAIADASVRFEEMIGPGLAQFTRRIGPLPADVPVYLMVAMGEFDGATREIAGRTYLLFGADMIASLHQGNDPKPLVQHELFHIYHGERFTSCAQMWCSLWSEGLAVYAAQTLNPQASDAELLLTMPEPIRPQVDAHRAEAICAIVKRLDSTDDADRSALFSFARLDTNLPPRFGYLIGSWVAEDLGRTRTLTQLAEWNGDELRVAIEDSLRSMADCP